MAVNTERANIGYSGRVLADGELGRFGLSLAFAVSLRKNVLQVIIRVDGFHESGFVKPRCRKSTWYIEFTNWSIRRCHKGVGQSG